MESGYKKTRDAELISHWHKPFDKIQASGQEFYTAVKEGITNRDIPQIKFSRVSWKEGGLFSANREYLRVEWKRYVYDICSAPLGTGCFFSSWLCILKRKLTIWHLIGMAISLILLTILIFTVIGAILMVLGLFVLAGMLREGKLNLAPSIEELLTGFTIIGPIIDVFFRPPTYFEIDTASMFHGVVHAALMEAVDALTDLKGIQRMTELERQPIMRDFFKK